MHINRGAFAQFEGRVKKLIQLKGSVDIEIQFIFGNGGTRPTEIIYRATAPDGTILKDAFKNCRQSKNMEEKNIQTLLENFIYEINKWEKKAYEISQNGKSEIEKHKEQKELVEIIFEKFCTKKERKRGLPNTISYGTSGYYNYHSKEEIVTEVLISKNKAEVYTYRENPIQKTSIYIFKKVKGVWLIDSKKKYDLFDEKWVNYLF